MATAATPTPPNVITFRPQIPPFSGGKPQVTIQPDGRVLRFTPRLVGA